MSPRTRQGRARTTTRWLPAFVLVVLAAVACGKIAGIDDLEIGECKGGPCAVEAGTETGIITDPVEDSGIPPNLEASVPDVSAIPCPPTDGGPTMVRVGTPTNNFCIDSTEVTVKQYRDFTTKKGNDTSGQPPQCAWNTDYTAGLGGNDDIPIAGIDWCDAYAFCQWAGKRLCGKQVADKFAGPVPTSGLGDFTSNEWLIACTLNGQLLYPYGATHQPTACNTGDVDAGRTVAVGSKPGCNGGFPGVYDMLGNLWEWYDGPCPPPDAGADAGDGGPAKHECFVKGGAFLTAGPNINCRVDGRGASRDRRAQDIGFRCCAD
ncbi:MAG: SUMF1/EgtB/PvdO family nonheme iron enzyme [Deltaproteobacteria bacterium]|nr:SUMF1/EgtB/PvdO family nonheme iron enzyme [Deltaproteobacteria bacterium]